MLITSGSDPVLFVGTYTIFSAVREMGRQKKGGKTHTEDRLDMRQIQQLQRINRQALSKQKFQQERNMHMQGIINRQRAATYESELARFENARLKGPMSTESYARMEKLKQLLQ